MSARRELLYAATGAGERAAHAAQAAAARAGVDVSLVSLDPSRDAYVFDVPLEARS